MKKKKQNKTKKLKDRLWELCKTIVRKRDGNVCFICRNGGLEGSGWHTGHLHPSSTCGAYLRYDLRNLHSSCYNCNINLGGNGAEFLIRLVQVYGKEFSDRLYKDKSVILKADSIFYGKKIMEFEEISGWDKDKLFDYTKTVRDKFPPESYMQMRMRKDKDI